MIINDLLTLMDREAGLLAEDNNHSAAAIMRAAAAKIRVLSRHIDEHGRARADETD